MADKSSVDEIEIVLSDNSINIKENSIEIKNIKNIKKRKQNKENNITQKNSNIIDLTSPNIKKNKTNQNGNEKYIIDIENDSNFIKQKEFFLDLDYEHDDKSIMLKCPVCWEQPCIEPATTICGHTGCLQCLKSAIKVRKSCPICRKKLTKVSQVHRLYI